MTDFKFGYCVEGVEAEWGDGDEKYTESMCIFKSNLTGKIIASCIIYWYHIDNKSVVIRNLYVLPNCRNVGVANLIIKDLKKYCRDHKKILKLWADKNSWLFQWYQRMGFVPGNDFEPGGNKHNFQWLTYDGSINE